MDIFFVVDKTNALLKATGWKELFISVHIDACNDTVKIRAHLNNEVIGTTHLPYNYLLNYPLENQNILVNKLHQFVVLSYDTFIHPSTTPPEPRKRN